MDILKKLRKMNSSADYKLVKEFVNERIVSEDKHKTLDTYEFMMRNK